jgi:hypothetical protein
MWINGINGILFSDEDLKNESGVLLNVQADQSSLRGITGHVPKLVETGLHRNGSKPTSTAEGEQVSTYLV